MGIVKMVWGLLSMGLLVWALNSSLISYIADRPAIIALLLIWTFVTANRGLMDGAGYLRKRFAKHHTEQL